MARYKKIYNDQEHTEDKKREKIRLIVETIVSISWIVIVAVMGVFSNDNIVTGMGMLILAIINICYAYFMFRIKILGWKIMTVYDSDELYKHKYRFNKQSIEQKTKQISNLRTVVGVLAAISVPVFIVLGICRLKGIL